MWVMPAYFRSALPRGQHMTSTQAKPSRAAKPRTSLRFSSGRMAVTNPSCMVASGVFLKKGFGNGTTARGQWRIFCGRAAAVEVGKGRERVEGRPGVHTESIFRQDAPSLTREGHSWRDRSSESSRLMPRRCHRKRPSRKAHRECSHIRPGRETARRMAEGRLSGTRSVAAV